MIEDRYPQSASERRLGDAALLVVSLMYVVLMGGSWLLCARQASGSSREALVLLTSVLGCAAALIGIGHLISRRPAIASARWAPLATWLSAGVVGGLAGWPFAVDSAARGDIFERMLFYTLVCGLWVTWRNWRRPAASAP
jgi:uncharacterized membrane protein HdeD (DUF308 family)